MHVVADWLRSAFAGLAGQAKRIEGWRRKRWLGGSLLLATLVVVTLLSVWLVKSVPDKGQGCPSRTIVHLEFAGSASRVSELYKCYEPSQLDRIPDGLKFDVAFIAMYVLALGWGCLDAAYRFHSAASRTFARAIAGLVGFAGCLDLAENLALWANHAEHRSTVWPTIALAVTVPKWAIVATAVPLAVLGAAAAWRRHKLPAPPSQRKHWKDDTATQWARNYEVPGIEAPGSATRVGICCSGGGIRSASFNLGVLQVLRERRRPNHEKSVLGEAEHLTAVSGGGYIAGAWQLLEHERESDAEEDPALWAPPVFAAGSLEEDHVRRHGRYLADSAREWFVFGSRVVAGLLLNIVVVVGLLYLVARPLGWVQHNVVFPSFEGKDVPTLEAGHWIAIGGTAGLALLLAVLVVISRSKTDGAIAGSASRFAWTAAAAFAALASLLLIVLVVAGYVPAALEWVIDKLFGSDDTKAAPVAATTTVTLVSVGTPVVLAVLTFKQRGDRRTKKKAEKKQTIPAEVKRWAPWVEKYAPRLLTLVLAVAAIIVFGLFVDGAASLGAGGKGRFLWWDELADWIGWAIVAAVLLILWIATDQTAWSLHPPYKRRLSTAFAIRRTPKGTDEYPYDGPTTLSTVLQKVDGFPQVTICAAANVSGTDVPAAGRRSASFTFGGDVVGSTRLGYLKTEEYEKSLPVGLRADATLLGAMAVSGAAFASAMGRQSQRWVARLLAIVNARLGVWLPSPQYVAYTTSADLCGDEHPTTEERPQVPIRRRGLGYLFREIFSMHDPSDPFLYLSDGGHWDNMALVEILRRRCTYVVCIDGSGDNPATLGTLADAIDLAYEELGVEINFADGLHPLRPGTGTPAGAGDEAIEKRLSEGAYAIGSITYPPVAGVTGEGTIVYLKALLVPGLPLDLQRYAVSKPRFPNEPTSDQWFSADQLNAYVRLGRSIATAVPFPR